MEGKVGDGGPSGRYQLKHEWGEGEGRIFIPDGVTAELFDSRSD
jgi:hypothetical protein